MSLKHIKALKKHLEADSLNSIQQANQRVSGILRAQMLPQDDQKLLLNVVDDWLKYYRSIITMVDQALEDPMAFKMEYKKLLKTQEDLWNTRSRLRAESQTNKDQDYAPALEQYTQMIDNLSAPLLVARDIAFILNLPNKKKRLKKRAEDLCKHNHIILTKTIFSIFNSLEEKESLAIAAISAYEGD